VAIHIDMTSHVIHCLLRN